MLFGIEKLIWAKEHIEKSYWTLESYCKITVLSICKTTSDKLKTDPPK